MAELEDSFAGFIHAEEEKTPDYPAVSPHKFAAVIDFCCFAPIPKTGNWQCIAHRCKEMGRKQKVRILRVVCAGREYCWAGFL